MTEPTTDPELALVVLFLAANVALLYVAWRRNR
jgi:hypothetical protein